MKKVLGLAVFFFALSVAAAHAQEKGVDQQNDRIRDQSSDRAP